MWEREHEEISAISDSVPVKDESSGRSSEAVVEASGCRIHRVVLVEESLVAGISELDNAKHTVELSAGGDCALIAGDRFGSE